MKISFSNLFQSISCDTFPPWKTSHSNNVKYLLSEHLTNWSIKSFICWLNRQSLWLLCVQVYCHPLSKMLSKTEHTSLFGNLSELLDITYSFLNALEQKKRKLKETGGKYIIGDVLGKMVTQFLTYFCNGELRNFCWLTHFTILLAFFHCAIFFWIIASKVIQWILLRFSFILFINP